MRICIDFSDEAPDDYLLELAALYLYDDEPDMALKNLQPE